MSAVRPALVAFTEWLDAWLPDDYDARWDTYRVDRALRKRWQADRKLR